MEILGGGQSNPRRLISHSSQRSFCFSCAVLRVQEFLANFNHDGASAIPLCLPIICSRDFNFKASGASLSKKRHLSAC